MAELRRAGKRSTESRNRFQANVALMRSLASMDAHVPCQIALLRKRFITHSAFERLLASMPAKMSRQMLRTQKRFIARSTYVWCDEHVSSRVTFQSAFITIRFITHFAFERPLASMILSLFFHLFLLFHLEQYRHRSFSIFINVA